MAKIIPSESQECKVFAEWLTLQGILFTKTTQETFTKSWGVKMKNKREGLRKGLPDFVIVIKDKKNSDGRNLLLFVEMKKQKGLRGGCSSAIGEEQKEWINALHKIVGVRARFCFGAEEAIEFVSTYLK